MKYSGYLLRGWNSVIDRNLALWVMGRRWEITPPFNDWFCLTIISVCSCTSIFVKRLHNVCHYQNSPNLAPNLPCLCLVSPFSLFIFFDAGYLSLLMVFQLVPNKYATICFFKSPCIFIHSTLLCDIPYPHIVIGMFKTNLFLCKTNAYIYILPQQSGTPTSNKSPSTVRRKDFLHMRGHWDCIL